MTKSNRNVKSNVPKTTKTQIRLKDKTDDRGMRKHLDIWKNVKKYIFTLQQRGTTIYIKKGLSVPYLRILTCISICLSSYLNVYYDGNVPHLVILQNI